MTEMSRLQIPQGETPLVWKTDLPLLIPSPGEDSERGAGLEESLDNPLGSRRLEEMASPRTRAVILVPDYTRAWQGVPIMASAVRKRLLRAGLNSVTWVFAGGQHRPCSEEEIAELLGDASCEEDRMVCHDPEATRDLGLRTERGTPVRIQPDAAEADLVVMIGAICYHDLAGFSGGRKMILPGISARESIQANHGLGLIPGGFHPAVTCGTRAGNPVAEDMADYLQLALRGKEAFILNVIPDGTGALNTYVAGDPLVAWQKGVGEAIRLQTLYVPRKAEMAVVSSGGFPYDVDLYQGTKALGAVYGALPEDGGIVLVAGLAEGMGTEIFDKVMRMALGDFDEATSFLKDNFTIPAYIAVKTVWDLRKRRCALVTKNRDVAFPGLVTPDLEEAVAHVRNGSNPRSVLFLPNGNTVQVRTSD